MNLLSGRDGSRSFPLISPRVKSDKGQQHRLLEETGNVLGEESNAAHEVQAVQRGVGVHVVNAVDLSDAAVVAQVEGEMEAEGAEDACD
mmetsp:Transcript_5882/g.8663  ORF Transcript_5882/g.8663 Transcript_5882/m.8663 type:complete len:89 (+) Transcript_5882:2932-3198(+)